MFFTFYKKLTWITNSNLCYKLLLSFFFLVLDLFNCRNIAITLNKKQSPIFYNKTLFFSHSFYESREKEVVILDDFAILDKLEVGYWYYNIFWYIIRNRSSVYCIKYNTRNYKFLIFIIWVAYYFYISYLRSC